MGGNGRWASLAFGLITCFLAPSAADAAKTHIAITCPTEDAYISMGNQLKAMLASGLGNHKNTMAIIANNGCTDDHVQPGQPPYQIQDTDGAFVIISNGTISGYMNKNGFDMMYVIGREEPGN